MDITQETLDRVFTYHPPKGDQQARYEEIRATARTLVSCMLANAPQSAERTLAVRRVQEAVMWANAAIAINESESAGQDVPGKPPVG